MKLRLTFSGRAQQENVVGKFFLRMRGKSQFVRVPDPQLRGEENKKKTQNMLRPAVTKVARR